jgi:hypothetical protein
VFDDRFSTIATSVEDLSEFNSEEWYKMFGETNFQNVQNYSDVEDQSSDLSDDFVLVEHRRNEVESSFRRANPSLPLGPPPTAAGPITSSPLSVEGASAPAPARGTSVAHEVAQPIFKTVVR